MFVKKTFYLLLSLSHSSVVDVIFDISSTILVMIPVETVFSGGGLAPISHVKSTLALFLTLGLNCQRRFILLTLGIAYLIPLLVY